MGRVTAALFATTVALALPAVAQADFIGTSGNDTFVDPPGLSSYIWGLGGDDFLDGRDGQDEIHGDGSCTGMTVDYCDPAAHVDGNDTLIGGEDEDRLQGDGGNDILDMFDGLFGDIGDCGQGTDTAYVDAFVPPGVQADMTISCESVIFNQAAPPPVNP